MYVSIAAVSALFLLGGVIGFLSAWITKLFDFCLDYGHIFGAFRLDKAKKSAELQGIDISEDLAALDSLSFVERITFMDSVYWRIARNDKGFLMWICVFCLGTRINIVLTHLIFIGLCLLNFQFIASFKLLTVFAYFIINFASAGINFLTLKKSE